MAVITAAVIGLGTAVYMSSEAKDQQEDQQKFIQEQMEGADPYAQYRPDAAARLNALSLDPSSVQNSASYKARLQAAARTVASQGYTGSGNALVAAAEAGASAYQQEFDNLAMLSGAAVGVQSAAGISGSAISGRQAASDGYISSLAGVANNATNLVSLFNSPAPSTGAGGWDGSIGGGGPAGGQNWGTGW